MKTVICITQKSKTGFGALRHKLFDFLCTEGVLEPRDILLWAHPSPNAKSLVETRLFGQLHINSNILVAGARFVLFLRS